jgi:antitoxin HicB
MPTTERSFAWPAKLTEDEDGRVLATFPDLPGAATDGADRAEALEEAADCLEEAIAIRLIEGEDIPAPSPRRAGTVLVPLAPLFAAKTALYLAMREQGINNTRLAKRMGCDEKEIRRLLDPRHGSKIERIDAALRQLDRRLHLQVTAA